MKSIQVGELKARFSEVLSEVKAGKTVVISYGRKHEKVAALVPYPPSAQPAARPYTPARMSSAGRLASSPA